MVQSKIQTLNLQIGLSQWLPFGGMEIPLLPFQFGGYDNVKAELCCKGYGHSNANKFNGGFNDEYHFSFFGAGVVLDAAARDRSA